MSIDLDVPLLTAMLGKVRGVFVTGTDTGVGKTLVSAALIRAMAHRGARVAGMKPVAAGAFLTRSGLRRSEDALALAAAANVRASYESMNPYCLLEPVSPHLAAFDESVSIDTAVIRGHFEKLAALADFVVVEGAGGWLAPIGPSRTMADVALALDLPVLMVVGLRLGCLNHALLTRRAIEASGARFAGWIGNHIDPELRRAAENLVSLERILERPALAVVPFDRAASANA